MNDAARAKFFSETRIRRIVFILRLVFGVEVIQIAKEFIETVVGRQMFIEIAEMILAELAGDIA